MAKKKYYLILDENGFVKSVHSTDNIPYGDIQVDWYPTDRPITEYKYDVESGKFTLDETTSLAELKKEKLKELAAAAKQYLEEGTDIQTETFNRTPLRFTPEFIRDVDNLRVQLENGVQNLYFAPAGTSMKKITVNDAKAITSTTSYYIANASALERAACDWCNQCTTVEDLEKVELSTNNMPTEIKNAYIILRNDITASIHTAKAIGKTYQEKVVE